MADAGKVVIIPKGKYSSTATYEWLDEVTYDGKAYVALKTVTGITPSDDGVNWRLYLDPNDIIAGDLVPTFTEAIERSNIVSGESLSTILGKVKKWFADLKGHAFNDTVKNLTTETTGSALDASQGKVLKDDIDELIDFSKWKRCNGYLTISTNANSSEIVSLFDNYDKNKYRDVKVYSSSMSIIPFVIISEEVLYVSLYNTSSNARTDTVYCEWYEKEV